MHKLKFTLLLRVHRCSSWERLELQLIPTDYALVKVEQVYANVIGVILI